MSPVTTTANDFGERIPHKQEKELPGNANWVVQKYGGTSLGKFPVNIAQDIIVPGLANHRIAVVCSARSTYTKSEGTTNRLLRAAREAEKPASRKYVDIVKVIREDHLAAGKDTIKDLAILDRYNAAVEDECDGLIKILESAQHLGEVSTRTEDKIVAKGEKLSCQYMTALLQSKGVDAAYVDLSEVITFDTGKSLDETFYVTLAKNLADAVHSCGAAVPVITGYFGNVPGGLLNQIGRGYTDLCAALVAVGLSALELQIWKEVDGIFTADPRKVPTARLLASVTPSEAAELTFYGSEVIHPFTMDQVIRASIPIRIKNVMNPRGSGTIILPDRSDDLAYKKPGLYRNHSRYHVSTTSAGALTAVNGANNQKQKPKRPTAVTIKRGITVLNVHSKKRTRSHGFLMSIFSTLDKHKLSVDLISSSEVHVSMALHSEIALLSQAEPDSEEMKIESEALKGAVEDLGKWGDVDLVPGMAIVSLVGRELRSMVGISGRFLGVLGEEGVNVEMISQGASEINISCVIDEKEANRALNVVHTNLFTFLD
ncbi:hypothetical protein CAC42_761 [Sphaceloma murrayae]|uniref:Aspartokinase n=1 Tax=Sphaceloma murrayae TaxID=2082308 RepID=A0A2K1QKQ1_9PEZI|nr:hypothetical protein CAC42_761 [Sphaceloma murrayae]